MRPKGIREGITVRSLRTPHSILLLSLLLVLLLASLNAAHAQTGQYSGTIQGQAHIRPSSVCNNGICTNSVASYDVADSGSFTFTVDSSGQITGEATVQSVYTGCGQPDTVTLNFHLSLAGSVQGSTATITPTFTSAQGVPFFCGGFGSGDPTGYPAPSLSINLMTGGSSSSQIYSAADDSWAIASAPGANPGLGSTQIPVLVPGSLTTVALVSSTILAIGGIGLGIVSGRTGGDTQEFRRKWAASREIQPRPLGVDGGALPRVTTGTIPQLPHQMQNPNNPGPSTSPCRGLRLALKDAKWGCKLNSDLVRFKASELERTAREAGVEMWGNALSGMVTDVTIGTAVGTLEVAGIIEYEGLIDRALEGFHSFTNLHDIAEIPMESLSARAKYERLTKEIETLLMEQQMSLNKLKDLTTQYLTCLKTHPEARQLDEAEASKEQADTKQDMDRGPDFGVSAPGSLINPP